MEKKRWRLIFRRQARIFCRKLNPSNITKLLLVSGTSVLRPLQSFFRKSQPERRQLLPMRGFPSRSSIEEGGVRRRFPNTRTESVQPRKWHWRNRTFIESNGMPIPEWTCTMDWNGRFSRQRFRSTNYSKKNSLSHEQKCSGI